MLRNPKKKSDEIILEHVKTKAKGINFDSKFQQRRLVTQMGLFNFVQLNESTMKIDPKVATLIFSSFFSSKRDSNCHRVKRFFYLDLLTNEKLLLEGSLESLAAVPFIFKVH